MIRLSWIVFVHAIILSAESIIIEKLTTDLKLDPLAIAANSIAIAGTSALLISLTLQQSRGLEIFRAWRCLVPGSVFLGAGIFMWYDSVERVGASKEGLLAGPLETVVVLLLARMILHERLLRPQIAGAMIALTGFFVTVISGSSPAELVINLGDIEAILSAAAFGVGIIFISKLAAVYRSLSVTSSSLFISGLILAIAFWFNRSPALTSLEWATVLLFSVLPLSAALTYVMGLARIGASLTSTIGSLSILLTVIFQIVLVSLGIRMSLPANIPLALTGGILGVFGIYLIHKVRKN